MAAHVNRLNTLKRRGGAQVGEKEIQGKKNVRQSISGVPVQSKKKEGKVNPRT